MMNFHEHLRQVSPAFERRRRLHVMSRGLPYFSKVLWAGGFGHLRKFDHDYSFTREGDGLKGMSFRGEAVCESKIPGRIDRPVTLVTAGPSSLGHDWDKVRGEGRYVVAVSGCPTFLIERGIRPDLLVLSDPDFCRTGGYHIRDAVGVPLVVEYRAAAALHRYFPESFQDRDIWLIERVNKWYGAGALGREDLQDCNRASGSPFHFSGVADRLMRSGWSHEVKWGMFPSSTVAFVALQVVVAMGAGEIEIVGMDLGGNGNRSIYTDSQPNRLREQYEDAILPSFQAMSEAMKGRGVTIRNLSPTCPLPAELFELE
jgi:hypothetical protein